MKEREINIAGLVLCFLLFCVSLQGEESQWKSVKNQNGIEVFTRTVAGSAINEFLAVTEVQSRIPSLVAMLDDTGSYTKWMYRCDGARLLHVENVFERVTYSVTTSPWPVGDRDVILKSVLVQDRTTLAVKVLLTGLPDYLPENRDKVRIRRIKGYWLFEPLGDKRVRITYSLHTDPGGAVPDFIVNSSIVDIPYNTLYNMRKMSIQPPYRDAVYKEIAEKNR